MGLIKEYSDIFKNRGLDFCDNRAIVIYSKNNGGKTRLLKQISEDIYKLNGFAGKTLVFSFI